MRDGENYGRVGRSPWSWSGLGFGVAIGLALAVLGPVPVGHARDDEDEQETEPRATTLVELKLSGSIGEAPVPEGFDGAPVSRTLEALTETIEAAAEDEDVAGILLNIGSLQVGPAKVETLRKAIRTARESGKPVHAWLRMPGNTEYLVAAAADEIAMAESGWLTLGGLSAEVTFFAGLLEKLGVEANFFQVGDYKGAGETFTRTSMSEPYRENLTSLLGDTLAYQVGLISERLGIPAKDARVLIDGGPYIVSEARKRGLINRIAYRDEVIAAMAEEAGIEPDSVRVVDDYGEPDRDTDISGLPGLLKLLQSLSGESRTDAGGDEPRVAVVYAVGTIAEGKSSPGSLFGGGTVGSETLVEAFDAIRKDDSIKAVVLRVDSPGGSALASDLIWRAIERVDVPVIASMSDTAASGGYYISVACDAILAAPATVTGSIGVVGGKLAPAPALEKFGINIETVTVGSDGALTTSLEPWNERQEAAVKRSMAATYDLFLEKVAAGRGMDREQVEELAGGRVYTGRQAVANGLVDELGDLDDAIALALERAGLDPAEEVERVTFPEPPGLFDALFGSFSAPGLPGGEAKGTELDPVALRAWSALAGRPGSELLGRALTIVELIRREPVLTVVPYRIRLD